MKNGHFHKPQFIGETQTNRIGTRDQPKNTTVPKGPPYPTIRAIYLKRGPKYKSLQGDNKYPSEAAYRYLLETSSHILLQGLEFANFSRFYTTMVVEVKFFFKSGDRA